MSKTRLKFKLTILILLGSVKYLLYLLIIYLTAKIRINQINLIYIIKRNNIYRELLTSLTNKEKKRGRKLQIMIRVLERKLY